MPAPPPATTVTSGASFSHGLWNNGPAALDAWMRDPPRAVLVQTVAQSISNGGANTVAFDTTLYDNYGGHGPAGGSGDAYIAKAAGVYLVSAMSNLAWGGLSGSVVGNYLVLSNQTTWSVSEIPAVPQVVRFQHCISALIPMRIGDFVQFRIYQNSGAAQPTGFNTSGCRMSVRWIAL